MTRGFHWTGTFVNYIKEHSNSESWKYKFNVYIKFFTCLDQRNLNCTLSLVHWLHGSIYPVSRLFSSAQPPHDILAVWKTGLLWTVVSAQMSWFMALWDIGQMTQLPRASLSSDQGVHLIVAYQNIWMLILGMQCLKVGAPLV